MADQRKGSLIFQSLLPLPKFSFRPLLHWSVTDSKTQLPQGRSLVQSYPAEFPLIKECFEDSYYHVTLDVEPAAQVYREFLWYFPSHSEEVIPFPQALLHGTWIPAEGGSTVREGRPNIIQRLLLNIYDKV